MQVIPYGMTVEEFMERGSSVKNNSSAQNIESMTSADYYADSYGHFGIHGNPLIPICPSYVDTNRCRGDAQGHGTNDIIQERNLPKFTFIRK